jgi:hypothetical protein
VALLGQAAIAMWWDVAAEWQQEFEDWHTHEHFPERMGIPGFLRGARWASADGGPGYFVMYELERHETLSSPAYLARLNNPSPWSTKLMPQHRHMVRSLCRVLSSAGGGIGRCAMTLRLCPQDGRGDELHGHLAQLCERLAERPGFLGGHLLQTETPAIATTTEQAIRGGPDPAADWVYVVTGYSEDALRGLRHEDVADDDLIAHGANRSITTGLYRLSCAVTPADFV